MKQSEFKNMVKEEIRKTLKMNSPSTKPSPSREPVTIPGKPPVEPKRRTLTPPNPNIVPERKPKAVRENEMDVIKKIVQKYKKLK
jgi:hypothetical protein